MNKTDAHQAGLTAGKNFVRGFTLIELMITVVIIGVLSAVAYPSYRNQVIKGNRAAAQGYMLSLASREEQYMLDRRVYMAAATNAALASTTGLLGVPTDVSKFYNLTVTLPTTTSYLITATPIAGTTQATDGALTLDNTGAKTPASKW